MNRATAIWYLKPRFVATSKLHQEDDDVVISTTTIDGISVTVPENTESKDTEKKNDRYVAQSDTESLWWIWLIILLAISMLIVLGFAVKRYLRIREDGKFIQCLLCNIMLIMLMMMMMKESRRSW
eukprot:TRINITY_DN18188_c0_g1_i1.p1 TRINITY_DN18188_c0_g1~~TRINITY_DN18188_c0_g1_i1.p1  ORF type:complete len:140 (-),score=13.55 TRINITY_DN18188_c0_g1_i1:71-445(-)